MAKYDGLIIPRSYSEYINKTDAATHSQAHQMSGVLDDTPTENSTKAVKSGGVYTALAGKQPTLTFDDVPTDGSNNPVKSNGIYDAINALENLIIPLGTVFPYAGATEPSEKYLICDGRAVSRTTYAGLFEVIGTTYGAGDESTTFNIPDYREVALVGIGTNGTDTIEAHDEFTLGQFKDDQMQTHTHSYANRQASPPNFVNITSATNNYFYMNDTWLTSGNPSGRNGDVTRTKEKGVNFIIKAK